MFPELAMSSKIYAVTTNLRLDLLSLARDLANDDIIGLRTKCWVPWGFSLGFDQERVSICCVHLFMFSLDPVLHIDLPK